MVILRIVGFLLAAAVSFAQSSPPEQAAQPEPANAPLTADAIMARVAANQDRSEELRKQYVYRQHTHILTHRPKGGRLLLEETADYDVVPTPDGTQKELKLLTGRYWSKGKYETFQGEPVPEAESLDGSLIHDFREDLSNEKTKDGPAKDLFPLTTEGQKDYNFTLLGQEMQEGRSVYHIGFRTKDKNNISWAGEAYIDAAEFQPVRVFTKLSRRIPFGCGHSWEPICRVSGSTWFTSGRRTGSGFLPRSGRSSGFMCCSSSTGMYRCRWRMLTFNTRTWRAR